MQQPTQVISQRFHHINRKTWVLLNKKIESPLIDYRQFAGGLRHSVGSPRSVLDQRHLADQRPLACDLDYIIAKPQVYFPFQQHVHLVALLAFPEKEIAGRKLYRVTVLTKKLCRIHGCS